MKLMQFEDQVARRQNENLSEKKQLGCSRRKKLQIVQFRQHATFLVILLKGRSAVASSCFVVINLSVHRPYNLLSSVSSFIAS